MKIEAAISRLLELQAQGVTDLLSRNDRGVAEPVKVIGDKRCRYDDGACLAAFIDAEDSPGTRRFWHL